MASLNFKRIFTVDGISRWVHFQAPTQPLRVPIKIILPPICLFAFKKRPENR